jgi:hypothetical protein
MRRVILLSIFLTIGIYGNSQIFKTGNVQFDASLTIINDDAKSDIGLFRTQLKLEYGASEAQFSHMSTNLKMEPAEIFFAFEVSKNTNRPIDEVLVIYKKNKHQGWGYVAKECGIKPGSPEFHKMKSHAGNQADNHHYHKNKGKGHDKQSQNNGKPNKPDHKKGKK